MIESNRKVYKAFHSPIWVAHRNWFINCTKFTYTLRDVTNIQNMVAVSARPQVFISETTKRITNKYDKSSIH